VYGYPIEEACKIAVDTSSLFLKSNPSITRVIFMLFSPGDLRVYEEYIQSLKRSDE
jgi:O-acetyl-ADP-ribose deacetylase (regulator of RNase III)